MQGSDIVNKTNDLSILKLISNLFVKGFNQNQIRKIVLEYIKNNNLK